MYKISHALIGLKGSNIDKIVEVHSHPQALQQCKTFIDQMGYKAIPVVDTGGSVYNLINENKKEIAAIAGDHFEMEDEFVILKKNISDNEQNYTRFLLLGEESLKVEADEYKTSTVLISSDKPGSLLKALQEFASLKLNLTKLESRPILGRPSDYKIKIHNTTKKNQSPNTNKSQQNIRTTKLLKTTEEAEEDRIVNIFDHRNIKNKPKNNNKLIKIDKWIVFGND